MSDKSKKEKKTRKQLVVENIISLGMALILVLMIRSSVIEAFKIPSGSMIPTLLVGDHIFVNKFSYGLKIPFLEWFIDEPYYIIKREGPKRGDIIVFKYPRNPSIYYIKRVIGLPGDVIEVRNKQLFVNDQPIQAVPISDEQKTEIFEPLDSENYAIEDFTVQRESFRAEEEHLMMNDRTSFIARDFEPRQVQEGYYFVMGDNRDHSNDSRFWGLVPSQNIKGRAIFIWLSAWIDFSKSEFTFNPSRIGTVLK